MFNGSSSNNGPGTSVASSSVAIDNRTPIIVAAFTAPIGEQTGTTSTFELEFDRPVPASEVMAADFMPSDSESRVSSITPNSGSNTTYSIVVTNPLGSGSNRLILNANSISDGTNYKSGPRTDFRSTTAAFSRQPTIATPFWLAYSGTIGAPMATIRGILSFIGDRVTGIESRDFDIIDSNNIVQDGSPGVTSDWTIAADRSSANEQEGINITATTTTANINENFRLRLKQNTIRSGSSGTDNTPSDNLDTELIPIDNRSSSTLPSLANKDQFTLTIPVPQNKSGSLQLSVNPRSFYVHGYPLELGPEYQQFLGTIFYDTTTDLAPVVVINQGNFNSANNTIIFMTYWENTTEAILDAQFSASDITVTGATGTTITLGARQGLAVPVIVGNLPVNTEGNLKITIAANSLGAGTNAAVDSPYASYDRRESKPVVTISTGGFDDSSDTVSFFAYWENTTGAILDSQFRSADITVSGATGATISLGARQDLAVPVTVSNLPANTNSNLKITIAENALGANTNTSTDSPCVGYDTREPKPIVTISAGSFDSSNRRAYFQIYWENTDEPTLDHNINGFTTDDITVSGASGATKNLGTRQGLSYPCYITIPTGLNGNVKIIIRANALGTRTNIVTSSACIAYDTREPKPIVTISAGGFDSSSDTVNFMSYWENTDTTELAQFTASDITVSGATGATASLGARQDLAVPITVSNLPANTNSNLKITIAENSLGTNTNEATDSPCVGYDTRKSKPIVTISTGGFDDSSDTVSFFAYWENTTGAILDSQFRSADITVSGATGATVSLGTRQGLSYPITVSNLPDDTNLNLKITIAANALGANTNAATDSPCVGYDTRPPVVPKPIVIISTGGFDSSSDTVSFFAYWENTTETILNAQFRSTDITVSGASGATVSLGTRQGLSYPITVGNLPANTESNLKITIIANALGSDTNVATESPCVGYDTRPEVQLESPYLEITNLSALTASPQTENTITIMIDAKIDPDNRIDIKGLDASDFIITSPAGLITPASFYSEIVYER